MKKSLSALVLFIGAFNLSAQIKLLWHVGLTNTLYAETNTAIIDYLPRNTYSLTQALVDRDGNTIVMGRKYIYPPIYFAHPKISAFVAKFNGAGKRLWEYLDGTNCIYGGHSIDVDKNGNIFLTTSPLGQFEPRPCYLIKLSPNGGEQWRVLITTEAFAGAPSSVVKVDRAGNAIVVQAIWNPTPRHPLPTLTAFKFFPRGTHFWQTELPLQRSYLMPGGQNIQDALAIGMDGSAFFVGGDYGSGFVVKINIKGKIVWYTTGEERFNNPYAYTSIKLNKRGYIVAQASDTGSLFSPDGRQVSENFYDYRTMGLSLDDNFLVGQGYYLELISPNGRSIWRNLTIPAPSGAISDGVGGWIIAGRFSNFIESGLNFTRIARDGSQTWTQNIHDFDPASIDYFLKAPDGTFRIISKMPYQNRQSRHEGIDVSAFSF